MQNRQKQTILLFAFLLCIPLMLCAQLKINELMSNNVSAVMDESYNYSMWVEIYNGNASSYNLNNYYFTDDLSMPDKWRPSSTQISAKGYAVLWFERDELAGHASFKLAPEGGELYLMDKNGNIVDQVGYPKQYRNISYGRTQDGRDEWTYFSEHSFGKTNNNSTNTFQRCSKPVFNVKGGFHSSTVNLTFSNPSSSETIYYTLDGSEPTLYSNKYNPGTAIVLNKTTFVRACTFADKKLPSDVETATYFINERQFNLPVVSIVTEKKNLTDNKIGIYVNGTNGIIGNCLTYPVNFNQDWDRPANFELYDEDGNQCLNQELDISIAGGCSRARDQKSLKISPRKKFGNNKLSYDLFPDDKPGHKYKSILYRNSGNDFLYSMMRDGFMQSIIVGRMDIDYQAYRPSVCFINGEYYGVQNLRERTNADYVYSNYGLDKEDIILLDETEMALNAEFMSMLTYTRDNNITKSEVYAEVGKMLDIDSYINYMIAEIYYGNTDWPHHNIKMWKKKNGGKWRAILYDTDFGFNLWDLKRYAHHTLRYALNDEMQKYGPENIYMLRRLMANEEFKNKFINRFCIHLSSTFEQTRVDHIMDSIAAKIVDEMVYHKKRFGEGNRGFAADIMNMKVFSAQRPKYMMDYLGAYFYGSTLTHQIDISSNISNATYLFNTESILDNSVRMKYFAGKPVSITPGKVQGYNFKHWELVQATGGSTIITNNIYQTTLSGNINLKAIYEKADEPSPGDIPAIYINEIVASNNLVVDEYYEKDDYIELYNGGETDVNIAGWYITDTPANRTLSQIPDSDPAKTTIPAKGRIILWADSQPEQGILHVDFNLSKDGETVVLSRRNDEGELQIVDQVTFPALAKNESYSRNPDGSDNWMIQEMTFNKPNGEVSSLEYNEHTDKPVVYPTHFRDYFIVGGAERESVKVFNLTGRIVKQQVCTSDCETVKMEGLERGMYIVVIANKSYKIIKI